MKSYTFFVFYIKDGKMIEFRMELLTSNPYDEEKFKESIRNVYTMMGIDIKSVITVSS